MIALVRAPLWPAGHLPLKGGDYLRRLHAISYGLANEFGLAAKLVIGRDAGASLISPLVGEMAGRPEGGNVERKLFGGQLR